MPIPSKLCTVVLAALCALFLLPTESHAQSTGGSMGGGSFGGSGSSYSGSSYSGSSSSYSGSSSSYSGSSSSTWGSGGSSNGYYSSSDESSGGGSGEAMSAGELALLIFIVIILIDGYVLAMRYVSTPAQSNVPVYGDSPPARKVDVSVLRLGIDWSARAHVQRELMRIAKTMDSSSSAGLLQMLKGVAVVLRHSKDSWIYGGVVDASPMTSADAEAFFTKQAMDSRERFKAELIRNADGVSSAAQAPADLVARTDEGQGLVVITLVMAVKGTLTDFGTMNSVEDVRAWLEALNSVRGHSLAACEVIWSPAAEADRMSSIELETLYPEMKPLHHSTLAGRAQCRFCAGHFPAELVSCPHCGARINQQEAA